MKLELDQEPLWICEMFTLISETPPNLGIDTIPKTVQNEIFLILIS